MLKKKIKGAAKKKAKSPAVAKGKSVVSKKTKAKATKSKAAVKSKKKTPAKKITKRATPVKAKSKAPAKKINKRAAPVKAKAKTKKVTKPVAPTILPHGRDQHFIPLHDKFAPVTHPDGHLVESQFHHNEEVALHQENQKVKANMATRMGRKPIFRNTRRGK